MHAEHTQILFDQLLEWGVQEFHVCAGARNLPLIESLFQRQDTKNMFFNHFEERCAAFYALGRIKSLQKPIVVITTSGTAVGELLPAVMEAYYAQLPLILITADRPKRYRNTGAPQSCEQKDIFGIYVSKCFDLEHDEFDDFSLADSPLNMPLHINACFDFALPVHKDQIVNSFSSLESFLEQVHHPLVLVSKIDEKISPILVPFLKQLNAPVYLESLSHLREHPELREVQIFCADKIWEHAAASGYEIDGVLKIGSTPTHRIWRDLEERKQHIPVFSISNSQFSGMPHASHLMIDMESFFSSPQNMSSPLSRGSTSSKTETFLKKDRMCHEFLLHLFHKYPHAEQSLIHFLSHHIPKYSRIFLGNSLPIRHWDLAATHQQKHFLVEASRGLNGIDGQLSSFFGFADESCQNWGIFGDLTALYDLSAPWVLRYRPELSVNIVIINNGGGKIFQHVAKGDASKFVQNQHDIHFDHWAQMWGLGYKQFESVDEITSNVFELKKNMVFELIPDEQQTKYFNDEFSAFQF